LIEKKKKETVLFIGLFLLYLIGKEKEISEKEGKKMILFFLFYAVLCLFGA